MQKKFKYIRLKILFFKKKNTQTNQAVHRIQIPAALLMVNSKQRINTSLND